MSEIPNQRRILVIDDNPEIHNDFRKIFGATAVVAAELRHVEATLFETAPAAVQAFLFQLDFASQGAEGLEMIRRAATEGRPYAVAFVDSRMPPGWDGVETITHLWQELSDLQIVFTTAYSDYSCEDLLGRFGHTDRLVVLKKPFDNIEVLQLAHTLTEKWLLLQRVRENTDRLEERVITRTAELQAANARLRQEMTERQRAEEHLRQSQKMEAIGQLAGGVAHDFNNMLTVIRGYAQCALLDPELTAKVRGPIQQIDLAAERATQLTRQLLAFSRKEAWQPELLNLNEVLGLVAKMLRRLIGDDVVLEMDCVAPVPRIRADRSMLEQVVLNLVVNARDAMPHGGRLLVQTTVTEFTPEHFAPGAPERRGSFVCLRVSDCGQGIPPEVLPRIFEPFFTTKAAGKGTGLGLATVYGIVKQHDGWIEVESAPQQGTTFQLFFPAVVVPAAPAPQPGADLAHTGGHEVILLVEDDLSLRNATRHVLQRYGYRVIPAVSGSHALKVWAAHGAGVDLLLTDMVMPDGISGGELAQRLRQAKPELKVVYTSGYAFTRGTGAATVPAGDPFLPKPYAPEPLTRIVRNCLDGNPTVPQLPALAEIL